MTDRGDPAAEAAAWLFENSLDVFIIVRDAKVLRVNPAWTALTGWSEAETVGKPMAGFIPAEDMPYIRERVQVMRAEGKATTEHRVVTKAGDHGWVRSQAKTATDGDVLIVLSDIGEERRRQVEAESAQRANELLRTAAGVYIWRYNPDTDVYLIDPDLSGSTAYGAAISRTMTAAEMMAEIHPEDREAMALAFMHTLTTGGQQIIEYRHRRPDDSGGYARMRAAWRGVRRAERGKWEVLGITQDISDAAEARDAAQEGERAAQAAGEAKAQFLANMSHEIRTPMNGVLGVLHLLREENLSAGGRKLLDEALACGAMLAELLNDVIDFSKIEAGRLELSSEAVDVRAAAEGVADLLRNQAMEKGLYLRTLVSPDIGWISADPVRLRQMLFNLVGNAVKFTLSGGVEVRVAPSPCGDARRLRVEIADTGVGIPKAAQAALFERFTQADGSTTRRFGGSGLGLSITRRIAELMDGEVGFESEEGKGSTFWFDIVAPRVAEPGAKSAEGEDEGLGGLRVLVVEDNATNRIIATRMLESLGAAVTTAHDGWEGVQAARDGGFDLIFMDVQMPVMDGLEATRTIRALPGEAALTPIIAMTANAMAHQIEGYRAIGMNGMVAKPMSPAAIAAEIARLAAEPELEDAA